MRTYREHQAFYDKLQNDVAAAAGKPVGRSRHRARPGGGERPALRRSSTSSTPAVILISGCQDNQTSMDGEHNGAFTEQLLKVWNQGGFQGNYGNFHARIKARMPADPVAEPVHARRGGRVPGANSRSASDAAAGGRSTRRVERGAPVASARATSPSSSPASAQRCAGRARRHAPGTRQGVGPGRHASAAAASRCASRRGRAKTSSCSTIANGPTLVLHPADARDLMLAQSGRGDAQRDRVGHRARGARVNEVVVPGAARLARPRGRQRRAAATRGWMGQAVLSGFQVLTGLAKDPAAKLAAAARDEAGRRQGRRRRLSPRAPTRSRRSRAAAASSTRCPPPATAGRCWCSCTALSPTPSAPSPSCGPCTTRPCASCSRATAIASTRSTTRPSASARSPTR